MRADRRIALWTVPLALLAGCGAEAQTKDPPAAPEQIVADAAKRSFSEPALALDMSVSSGDAGYRAAGLIEPQDGRFRVELSEVTESSRFTPGAVIGLEGEGFESTVSEGSNPPGGDQRCWFNPLAPVGSFLGTASVEESVRLLGSTLESLPDEIAKAGPGSAKGAFVVELAASAGKPADDFRDSKERIWGDRNLFDRLDGPIGIELAPDQSEVQRISLELRDYQPYDFDDAARPIERVRIEASISPTNEELVLDAPDCQAIE